MSGSGDETPRSEIAVRLRDARRAKGMTQQQVSDALGVSRRAVSEWETGIRQPHVALPGLAALYGVSTTFLLYGVEPASAELRELRDDVARVLDEISAIRTDLTALAETTEAAFAEVRALIETKSAAADSVEPPADGLRDEQGPPESDP